MFLTFSLFKAILIALFASLIMAWVSIRLANRLGLIDEPGSQPHKQHFQPTPLAGGIALFSALLISELVMGALSDPNILITFLTGTIVFGFGLWDDFKSLPPLTKFAGQILAALVLIRLGISIRILESPQFFINIPSPIDIYLDWLLTILWIVGITNAFNFVDSMDGLVVGLGGMAAAFFMVVTQGTNQPVLSLHSAMIVGVCISLYLFNSPPALLFLGDSGAQTLGFILAVLGIAYNPQGANQSSSWFVPILLLGVPIFDTVLIVFSRMRRRRPIYSAGLDHTYHRLFGLGMASFRAVVVMHLAALMLGCLAFIILPLEPLIANLTFLAVIILGILAIYLLEFQIED